MLRLKTVFYFYFLNLIETETFAQFSKNIIFNLKFFFHRNYFKTTPEESNPDKKQGNW